MTDHIDIDSWTCPLPLRDHDRIVIGHGGGGQQCAPRSPLGATMASSEGACAAYYQYRRLDVAPVEVGLD